MSENEGANGMLKGTVSWKLEGLGSSPSWVTYINCLPFCSLVSPAMLCGISGLREVLGSKRKTPGHGGDSSVGEEGS